MVLSLIFLGLIVAIILIQAPEGLFSSLVMTVLTICCAAFAFGSYEWLATKYLAGLWQPDLAHPISLAVLFGVPLLIFRLICDKFIRRSCLLPSLVDKIGGGVCSFITAMIMVGVAAVAIQMIPIGPSLLGFSRFDVALSDESDTPPVLEASDRGLWLAPDKFAVGTAAVLSNGVFSGRVPLTQDHPDLVQAAGWDNTGKPEMSRYAPPGSISVDSTLPLEVVFRLVPGNKQKSQPDEYEPIPPKAGHEFHVVRVKLKASASDSHKSHIFSLRQFRLVGDVHGEIEQYFPIATKQAAEDHAVERYVSVTKKGGKDWPDVDTPMSPLDNSNDMVDVVFELPTGFKPRFIEYKRAARANVSFAKPERKSTGADAGTTPKRRAKTASAATEPKPEPPPRSPRHAPRHEPAKPATTSAPSESTGNVGGRTRAFGTIAGKSFFGNKLPFELRFYRGMSNVEVSRGALSNGHLIADAKQPETGDEPVSTFQVPEDKRLLQLNVGHLKAGSVLGKAMSFAVTTVQNYVVMDENGKPYKIIGKYALAKVNGEDVFEVEYFPGPSGSIGGLGKFSRINERELKKGDEIVFLFLIDPGQKIVRFTTGGAANQADNLRAENLVAPK